MAPRIVLVLSVLALSIVACGTPQQAAVDGGSDAYARPDSPTPADSCDMDHLHRLDGVAGGSVSIDFDTRMTETHARDLGLGCGNPAADIRWAPQEVVELHVPGTGPQAVVFSTSNTMTAIDFNTLIQVRTGNCRTIPTGAFPPTCFDDITQTNVATNGAITVMGGSTVYFIVTGYSDPPAAQMTVDQGNVHVSFDISPNTPPVITAASVTFSGADVVNTVTATDAEGPIAGYAFTLYVGAQIVDLNGDNVGDANDQFTLDFDTVDRMPPTYTGHRFINGMTEYTFAAYCRANGVTQWGMRAFDGGYARSDELRVDVHEAEVVGIGATCDSVHVCPAGLTCTAATCNVTAAATAACTAAQTFALVMPTTAATQSYVTGTVGSGTGVFQASCAATPGREQIWDITIPAGTWDLALTTAVTGTGATADTVLSLRTVCADGSTELPMGCNDDINLAMRMYRSAIGPFQNIPPGHYWAFVEAFGAGGATPYTLQATLTPVLAMGDACDPAGVMNRCATGACGATSHVCP